MNSAIEHKRRRALVATECRLFLSRLEIDLGFSTGLNGRREARCDPVESHGFYRWNTASQSSRPLADNYN